MISELKAIEIINKYLTYMKNPIKQQYFPLTISKIHSDRKLCELLIDFLGDMYTYCGMDANYEDTACGDEIQKAITYLAFCIGNFEE